MSLTKVPNSIESNWEALDIFLFCNGENTTPPRKYHLKSEDLEKWNDTLKRIAQSQYGIKESDIDLYTIDGEKLTTPIEIENNNVYVAVPHTEQFIPAGYNEYLLKASRSREKRQGKIRISKDVTIPETVEQKCNKINISEDTKNKTNNGTDHQVKMHVENQPMLPPKSDPGNKILEQTNNKKTFHLPFPRKYSRNVPLDTANKTSLKNKECPLTKKNLKVNMEKNVNKDRISITNPNCYVKTKGKESNKFNSLTKNNTSKIDNNEPEVSNKIQNTPKISDENSLTTDNPVIEDLICDKELIVVKKPESISIETGVPLSRPIITLSEISSLPRLGENITNKEETFKKDTCYNAENIKAQNVAICNVQTSTHHCVQSETEIDKNIYANTLEYQFHTDNPNTNNDSQPTENFIAIVDEGDIINFNMKLKLKKWDGTVKTHTDNKLHFITENNCKSDIIKEMTEDEKTSKIMVMQCSCCCHDGFDEMLSSDPIEKMYFALVPYIDCRKQRIRCNCEQEGTTPLEMEMDKTRSSIVNPITKVNADTSLIKITDDYDLKNGPEVDIKIHDVNISRKQSLPRTKLKESLNDDSETGNKLAKDENFTKTNKFCTIQYY